MGKIDVGRVFLGGLLCGLIINIGEFILNEPIMGEQWASAMEAMNLPVMGGGAVAIFVVMGFILGIITIWLYASIRPRFGPGPKTAICAGLFVWFFVYLYVNAGSLVIGMFPTNLLIISTIWGLFEIPIATVLGAWLYKEAAAA
jgi:hypothetical protein